MTDYVPHTDQDRRVMLESLGHSSIEGLVDDVPRAHRFPNLNLPSPLTEHELDAHMNAIAARNSHIEPGNRFIGAGSYCHHIPAVVEDAMNRSEFYTSYTPYQPEMSQGMLQGTFEYQSMICRLTGMDVSNASHYDGATALAEAVLMAQRIKVVDNGHVLMAHSINPNMRAVVRTYLENGTGTTIAAADSQSQLIEAISPDTVAVVVQQPDFFGALHNLQAVADAAHQAGCLLIVIVNPLSLALFKSPGEYGADIVVAEGQCLGLPTSFGGPGLGILATRKRYMRQLAGRVVGETVDCNGTRGYVLTMATREQHIRRERATSNICTNAAMSALTAAAYLACMGKSGLRELANVCYQRAHYAANALSELPGFTINPGLEGVSFFNEFIVELPIPTEVANQRLFYDSNIIGGYELCRDYPDMTNCMLLAFTECNSRQAIDSLVAALGSIASI